jgi:glycosyltransferase involved in cell wall biosynthesis
VPSSEIIIVDDGSTDDSISVIEKLAREHASIRLIRHEKNSGTVAAINSGLAVASGEFVFFPAADDFVLPNLTERAVTALRAYPQAGLFCGGVVMVDPDDRIVSFRPFTEPARTARYVLPQEVRKLILTSDNWIVGPTVVYRRELLLETGGFDAHLASFADGIIVRKLALLHGFYFDPDILAGCTVHPQSFSAGYALSANKNRALIDIVRERAVQLFPEDICGAYSELLTRRLRFAASRLSLLFDAENPNADGVSSVFGGSTIDRRMLWLLRQLPFISRTAILGWMFIRTRPFGVWSVINSWWNHRLHDPARRIAIGRFLAGTHFVECERL